MLLKTVLSILITFACSFSFAAKASGGRKAQVRKFTKHQIRKVVSVDLDLSAVVRLIAINTLKIEVLALDIENENGGYISTGQTLAQMFNDHRNSRDDQGRLTSTIHYDRIQCRPVINKGKSAANNLEKTGAIFSCRIVVVERLKEMALTTYNFRIQKLANSSELRFVSPIDSAVVKNPADEKSDNPMQALVLFLDPEKDAGTFSIYKGL